MNVDIIEPFIRVKLPLQGSSNRISSINETGDYLYVGTNKGDLYIYCSAPTPNTTLASIHHSLHLLKHSDRALTLKSKSIQETTNASLASRSIRSFRSYQDAKHLFTENSRYHLQHTFTNLTQDGSSISTIKILPPNLCESRGNMSKQMVLIISPTSLKLYELVGNHSNLLYSLDEPRITDALYINGDENGNHTTDRKENQERLLLISLKRKVFVVHITNKSRNVLRFNMLREILLKGRVQSLTKFNDDSVIVGTDTEYVTFSFDDFHVSPLAASQKADVFSQGAPFKYFGLSASGPLLWILDTGYGTLLLIRDTTVVALDKRCEEKLSILPIKLSVVPLAAIYIRPMYVAFVYQKRVEIYDLYLGILVQKFTHYLNSQYISALVEGDIFNLACGLDVLQFNISPPLKQILQFLNISGRVSGSNTGGNVSGNDNSNSNANFRHPQSDLKAVGIELAIQMVTLLESNDNNELFSSEKTKLLKLRELYKLKSIYLFDLYARYNEALVDIASEWMVSYHDVLQLFPDFLNAEILLLLLQSESSGGETHDADHDNKSMVPMIGTIKKVTKDELETVNLSESEYETDTTRRTLPMASKKSRLAKSQGVRRFIKAVNNLIIYLTEQRRILALFMDKGSIKWKNVLLEPEDIYPPIDDQLEYVATIIDTSLFLCYFYTKPMLLGPLLRLPNNRCDSKIVNECLLSGLHNHVQQRNMMQPNYVAELLDFYFGRQLHEEALDMLKKLALENEDAVAIEKDANDNDPVHIHASKDDNYYNNYVTGPQLTVRYLQRLTNKHLSLIFEYALWVIDADESNSRLLFMNDSYECESLDNMAVLQFFVKRKDFDLAIEYLEWLLFKSDMVAKLKLEKLFVDFETKLCLLYLKQIKAHSLHEEEYYKSLWRLLSTSETFDPWPILREIPTTEDKFLRLTVFVYKKLHEHENAVDVLYGQLNDLDEAIEYCSLIYRQPQGKQIGQNLFHKLLEDLLMNYSRNKNVDQIAKLLLGKGLQMSVERVFKVLPPSFPLFEIAPYLRLQVQRFQNDADDTRVNSQLYKVGSINLKHQVLQLQDQCFKINSSKTVCPVCKEKLGYSILTVTDNKDIIHYGCSQRLRQTS